tara:strand:- start:3249 stop:5900 length:2652 start_codon:yes stop_codon:yes gene_type:complete
MNNSNQIFQVARQQIIELFYLKSESERTKDNLEVLIKVVCDSIEEYRIIDKDAMILDIQFQIVLTYEEHKILKEADWDPWIYPDSDLPVDTSRDKINWLYFKHYESLIKKKYGPEGAKKINKESLEVLRYLMDPMSGDKWYRKGLVVGQVQSGKTSNYNGLITRAADTGYRFFIILAGAHNDLRSQTQSRLDEDFLGKITPLAENGQTIGVGHFPDHPNVITFTSSDNDGDFNKHSATVVNVNSLFENIPTYLVMKKNVSILKRLYSWLENFCKNGQIDIPLLFIDDEADYASVDTQRNNEGVEEDYNPTKINLNIRRILSLFAKKSYVGYTATPFANILIHRERKHPEYGPDLFPDNFIINIKPPNIYTGPLDYFGIHGDIEDDPEIIGELPLTREVTDHGILAGDNIIKLPDSLKQALRSFVLVCAARKCRNQGFRHNSMLVHTSRFTAHQAVVKDLIETEIETIRNEVLCEDFSQLKDLWENDFVLTTNNILNSDEYADEVKLGISIHNWPEIKNELNYALDKLLIKEVNASAGDLLEYRLYEESGINYIAIGGDKLSRGLTLEGLSVSYYLRTAGFYDTLMQMGRWFGYRNGYLDLCRLYTTYGLITNYRKITKSTKKLMDDFDEMVQKNMQPKDFGMKVLNDPGRLTVTNLGKRRHGEFLDVCYWGEQVQTMSIYLDEKNANNNYNTVNRIINSLNNPDELNFGKAYYDVSPDVIIDFLDSFNIHPTNNRCNSHLINDYIVQMNENNDLNTWTVCLVSMSGAKERTRQGFGPGDEKLGMIKREGKADKVIADRKYISFGHGFRTRNHIESLRNSHEKNGILLIYNIYGDRNDLHYGLDNNPCIGFVIDFPSRGQKKSSRYLFDHLYLENIKKQLEIFE